MTDTLHETQDAAQKAAAYAGLARNYLNNGEVWMAVHAQVAADLFAAKAVCGFDPSTVMNEDGTIPFADFVASAPRKTVSGRADSHGVVTFIREGIETLIPSELISAWQSVLADVSGFAGKKLGSDLLASALVSARLGDLTSEDFVIVRFEEAAELYAQAAAAEAAGDLQGSIRLRHQGDLATFEGWLVQRSVDVADHALIQTTLRWDLAMTAIDQIGELPEDPQAASRVIRSRMAWALGPKDAEEFASLFVTN